MVLLLLRQHQEENAGRVMLMTMMRKTQRIGSVVLQVLIVNEPLATPIARRGSVVQSTVRVRIGRAPSALEGSAAQPIFVMRITLMTQIVIEGSVEVAKIAVMMLVVIGSGVRLAKPVRLTP